MNSSMLNDSQRKSDRIGGHFQKHQCSQTGGEGTPYSQKAKALERSNRELEQSIKELEQSNRILKNSEDIIRLYRVDCADGKKPVWKSEGSLELERDDPRQKWMLEMTFISATFLNQHWIFGIGKDITERKMAEDRIQLTALIHEKLYRSNNFSQINLADYVRDLTGELYRSLHVPTRKVELDLRLEDVTVGIDQAVPCGLILNELV